MQISEQLEYERYIGEHHTVDPEYICPICGNYSSVACSESCCPDCVDEYVHQFFEAVSWVPENIRCEIVDAIIANNCNLLYEWELEERSTRTESILKMYNFLGNKQKDYLNERILERFIAKCKKYNKPDDLEKVGKQLLEESKFEIDMEEKFNGRNQTL